MKKNHDNLEKMALDELIRHINGFTALSRERELNEIETAERKRYREEYIRRIGRNLRATLDNTDFEYAGEENGGNSQKTDR